MDVVRTEDFLFLAGRAIEKTCHDYDGVEMESLPELFDVLDEDEKGG